MPNTYTLKTRILSSNSNPYKSIYSNNNYDSYDNDNSSSNYWILIFLLIVLTLIAIFVGSIYKTNNYFEGFQNGDEKKKTLYFFYMENCGWCHKFRDGAWSELKDDMNRNSDKYSFKIGDLDINNDEKGQRYAKKYNIRSTPTLILIDDTNEDIYEEFKGNRDDISEIQKFGNKN